MADNQIKFDNGATYEEYMGKWSQLVGEKFLSWLSPKAQLRWLDVGCGNGAFTEMIVSRRSPSSVHGIDPSEAQLAFARTRSLSAIAHFQSGDAMDLPFPNSSFDVAVMPLVIFFVPEPKRGVEEMKRVVSPGGVVSAYAWDMIGGGFPYEALIAEIQALGITVPMAPSTWASQISAMEELWCGAGLEAIETEVISVERTFPNFDAYWSTILGGPSVSAQLAAMTPENITLLKSRMRSRLITDPMGRITCGARANAVKGRVGK